MPEDEQSNQNGEPKDSSDSSQQGIPDASENAVPVQPSGAEISHPWGNVINAALLIVLVVSGGILLLRLSGENAEEVLALIAIMTPVIGGILAALIGRERREAFSSLIKKQFDELRTTALLAILSVIVLALLALNLTGRFPMQPDRPLAQPRQTTAVRAGPSRQYAVLESVTPDQMVEITGISDDGEWYHVRSPDSGDGWLEAGSVVVQGSVNVKIVIAPTITPTPSITPTASDTPSITPSATSTDTPSLTPTPSATPTLTGTPSLTPTPTDTPTDTPRPSDTPRPPSPTPRPSDTPVVVAQVVVPSGRENIGLYFNAEMFVLYIAAPTTVSLQGIMFRVRISPEPDSFQLSEVFDELQLTGDVARPGECYVLRLVGSQSPLPRNCQGRVFPSEFNKGEAFWFNDVQKQLRDIAVYQNESFIDICPGTSGWCWIELPILLIATPTFTPTPTPTDTPTFTFTPTPTDTPTPTPTLTDTPTNTPTDTPTFTPTPTNTPTLKPTFTPTEPPCPPGMTELEGRNACIQAAPVSNEQFMTSVTELGYPLCNVTRPGGRPGNGARVAGVTLCEAVAYCRLYGWRLANDDEWVAAVQQDWFETGAGEWKEWVGPVDGEVNLDQKYTVWSGAGTELIFPAALERFDKKIGFRCAADRPQP